MGHSNIKSPLRLTRPHIANLAIACAVPLLVLALSYMRIIGDASSGALDSAVLETIIDVPLWNTALGANLALFALTQVTIHVFFGLGCLALAYFCNFVWGTSNCTRRSWLLLWLTAGTLWVLVANATWFPATALGSPYAQLATIHWHGINALGAISLVLLILMAVTIIKALKKTPVRMTQAWPRYTAAGMVGLAVILLVTDTPAGSSRQTLTQPDVVIIGLDSLRTDAIGKGDTPAIDAFLAQSARFSDAITPLARTFPSWVSLLTGKHPHTTGATINLLPRHLINTGETLPQTLRRSGYSTMYAIDEVRFSNLDTSYGFDKMIAPPIGATDFLLGFFADTPLSNVLVNTFIGRKLFPYAHANRAAAKTYDPDTFVRNIERELPTDSPLFLAVHLTLAHWPYSWADAAWIHDQSDLSSSETLPTAYRQAVRRLDRQFSDLMEVLRDHGLQNNAVTIVFSDHGESLGERLDEHVHGFDSTDPSEATFFGHGTSILARDQYHIVLGIRSSGVGFLSTPDEGFNISSPVSLEDITPTIVEAFSLDSTETYDGLSLVTLLQRTQTAEMLFAHRIRFTETEFNPPGITPGAALTASALKNAAKLYHVDAETDRVSIREDDIRRISEQRQFAAFRGQFMVATLPAPHTQAGVELAQVSMRPGQPFQLRMIDQTSLTQDTDALALWEAMRLRFPDLAERLEISQRALN